MSITQSQLIWLWFFTIVIQYIRYNIATEKHAYIIVMTLQGIASQPNMVSEILRKNYIFSKHGFLLNNDI